PSARRRRDLRDAERVRLGRRTYRREHTDGAVESRTRERHLAHVVATPPILAVRRMTLARDDDDPDVREGREHRRPRPHHHVEPPLGDPDPRPRPATAVAR